MIARLDVVQAEPRLFDATSAAAYLSVSTWHIRALVANGVLKPVRLPACHRQGETSRRLLFDRADLDALVDRAKGAGL